MKKIILVTALALTANANALSFDDQNTSSDLNGDFDGRGDAAGEATFSVDFKGKRYSSLATKGDFKGNIDNNDSGYHTSNSDFFENGNADFDGKFDGASQHSGQAEFAMSFSGKGNTSMETKGSSVANASSTSAPYGGYAPYYAPQAPAVPAK